MRIPGLMFFRALAIALIATAAISNAASEWPQATESRSVDATLRSEVILHAFNCCNGDGYSPQGELIRDSSGALYGTDISGGPLSLPYRAGTVFKLIPPAAGGKIWKEDFLHLFSVKSSPLGYSPVGGLVGDLKGNLYGTTSTGGNPAGGAGYYGTVFELSPVGKTSWKYQLLHRFTYTDGNDPIATLVRDAKSGNLYGTTVGGGSGAGCNGGCGVLFQLAPPKAGATAWVERTLLNFSAANGANPEGSLLLGKGGVLYGTTSGGGPKGYGTVFSLTPAAAGKTEWSETILHAFESASDGGNPVAGLVADKVGALYGTTSYAGTSGCGGPGCGTVFKLTPPAAGKTSWTKTSLYVFGVLNNGIGSRPTARLNFDAGGTLYGTTYLGGTYNYGTVFALTPPPTGKTNWTATLLHTFNVANGDGGRPMAGVIPDDAGNLYGTASVGGGRNGAGIIYELKK